MTVSELAGQANGAVLGRHGDTAVLAAVVMGQNDVLGDYFPLKVDYEERFYAAGRILGSRFIRREGRPSDEAILSSRLIDRTIRPLFDARLRREVQVTVTVLAYDEKHDPDTIALLSASAALAISDIPWNGPIAGVKIVKGGEGVENYYQSFWAGTEEKINMIEFGGREVEEKEAQKVFHDSHSLIKKLVKFQKDMVKEIGRPKTAVALAEPNAALRKIVADFLANDLETALREKGADALKKKLFEHVLNLGEPEKSLGAVEYIFETMADEFVHHLAIEKNERVDGRKMDELRNLYAQVGFIHRNHGSALFMRGNTQVLAATTLDAPGAEQLIENMEGLEKKRFMLHYNFPGFAVGEPKGNRSPGRREIGHGALAAKALTAMIPAKDSFPYTIRVVAETLSSNGSSSMASTCAGCLSLMDAGVPIEKHVAGIAMGLMTSSKGHKILTDIQGPEDHYGDMDFKVAGTVDGLNAIQMDVKIDGITAEIFEATLTQAREARLRIIEVMKKALPASREKVSPFAPSIFILDINPDKIGLVVGPGGKTINGIIAATGGATAIDIEQTGRIFISNTDRELAEKALEMVKGLTREYKVGETVSGPIIKILEFGAIVDLGGGQDGMIHVSELKDGFVKKVEDVVKMGDVVAAKIIKAEDGRIGLSLKAMNKK